MAGISHPLKSRCKATQRPFFLLALTEGRKKHISAPRLCSGEENCKEVLQDCCNHCSEEFTFHQNTHCRLCTAVQSGSKLCTNQNAKSKSNRDNKTFPKKALLALFRENSYSPVFVISFPHLHLELDNDSELSGPTGSKNRPNHETTTTMYHSRVGRLCWNAVFPLFKP